MKINLCGSLQWQGLWLSQLEGAIEGNK